MSRSPVRLRRVAPVKTMGCVYFLNWRSPLFSIMPSMSQKELLPAAERSLPADTPGPALRLGPPVGAYQATSSACAVIAKLNMVQNMFFNLTFEPLFNKILKCFYLIFSSRNRLTGCCTPCEVPDHLRAQLTEALATGQRISASGRLVDDYRMVNDGREDPTVGRRRPAPAF